MDNLLSFWTELAGDTSASVSPLVLSQALDSAETHRIWDSSSDESLKSVLSLINAMLNEPRTRQKGLMLLTRFVDQLDSTRYVGIQDTLVSTLHLCLKSLDLDMANRFFSKVLPHCQKLPELSQTITSGIVPKILSNFCDASKTSHPSSEEMTLLKVCLDKYHGPCGNQRMNLERILVTLIYKSETSEDDIELIGTVLPLLSAAGGGGTNGEKHSADWSQMVIRILREVYDCLTLLYGDASPMFETDNPFHTELPKLGLPDCRERNVLLRISLIKARLTNLASVLGHYLKDAFPAPKPVPLRSVFSLVRKMMTLNPVDLLKSFATAPKEYLYLSFVLPSIHQAGFNLLGSLIKSVGANILTEAVIFEQLTLQEFKWMSEKPSAFVELKLEIYKTLKIWLNLSRSSVTSDKVVSTWAKQIRKDVQIEKDTVELNLAVRMKGNKKGVFKASTKTQFISASLNSSGMQNIKLKNSNVCSVGLEVLSLLIPALDPTSHNMIYQVLGTTVTELTESQSFPSPYDHPECRRRIYECIGSLARHANPFSPISLSFSINIVDKGQLDPAVAATSRKVSSLLERITHPICPSFNFPTISTALTSDVPEALENEVLPEDEPDATEIQTTTSFCQTDDSFNVIGNSSISTQLDMSGLQDSILATIQNSFKKLVPGYQSMEYETRTENSVCFSPDPAEDEDSSSVQYRAVVQSPVVPIGNGYGNGKRKEYFDPISPANAEVEVYSKKFKGEGDELNVEDMLKDFVDTGPEN